MEAAGSVYDSTSDEVVVWWKWRKWRITSAHARYLYYVITLLNLFVLAVSLPLPFFDLHSPADRGKIRIQFAIVTLLDLGLAVMHTVFLLIRVRHIPSLRKASSFSLTY